LALSRLALLSGEEIEDQPVHLAALFHMRQMADAVDEVISGSGAASRRRGAKPVFSTTSSSATRPYPIAEAALEGGAQLGGLLHPLADAAIGTHEGG
jgi:hypothetical protein